MRTWLAATLTLLLAPSAQAKCKFELTDEVLNGILRPALALYLGEDDAKWYGKSDKPLVRRAGDNVEIVFVLGRPNVLDSPFIMLVLEDCTSRVSAAYWARPFPNEPWHPLAPMGADEVER